MTSPEPPLRSTKIVATLGPASCTEPTVSELVSAGVNVFRINSSHGDPAEWGMWMEVVRRVRESAKQHVGILVDLQGPRIRVGTLPEPLDLEADTVVVFAPQRSAAAGEIPTTYDALANDVAPGARLLLDDGLMVAEVSQVRGDRVHAVVRYGGVLRSNKGINLPGVQVSAPTVTARDQESLRVAIDRGADLIGVSFVRRAADVTAVRQLVPPGVRLVAKIEKTAALDDLPRVIDAADALMVARGDLGVELPFEEVPLVQKRLIKLANRHARPVITATQMLESMVRHPRPTRAEASDVANAILDGTDAVMLSAETAIGVHPVEAVRAMVRIILEIERSAATVASPHRASDVRPESGRPAVDDAIAAATSVAAGMLDVPVIVCFTKSGFTARKISANRPAVPIVGLSTEAATCRYLSLVWGVQPQMADCVPDYDAMLGEARKALTARGLARVGDQIVVTAGVPFDVPGTTNLLKVETL